MASRSLVTTTVQQFQSETDLVCSTPLPRINRVVIWTITAGLALAVATTLYVRVDRTVTSASGKIISSDQTLVVQALNPSIVKAISVKEGQAVEKGQLLATLDATMTTADLTQTRLQIASLTAQVARADAQYKGLPFDPPLATGSEQDTYYRAQKIQYDSNQAQYTSSVKSFDNNVALNQQIMSKFKNDEDRYNERLVIAQKHEAMEQYLVAKKTDSLLSLLTATDARAELQRQAAFSHNSYVESQHTVESIKADRAAYVGTFLSGLASEIVTARNNLDTAQASFDKATKFQQLVQMTAPEAGIVFNLNKLSTGSVLKQGDQLLTITPSRAPIVAQANILSRDIGAIRVGDPVRLKVDALNYSEHGYADGRVSWVSENAFTADDNGTATDPYYKTQVTILDYHFYDVPPNVRLTPGMTLTADVNVGSRLLGRYLLGDTLGDRNERMR